MGKSWVLFSGVCMRAICRLKSMFLCDSDIKRFWCKILGGDRRKLNQFTPHCQFSPGLFLGTGHLMSKGVPGPPQSVPLSTMLEALIFYYPFVSEGNPFSSVPPPYSKQVVPFPMATYLSSRHLPSRKPVPNKWHFALHLLFFCCCSLLNTLKATSTN